MLQRYNTSRRKLSPFSGMQSILQVIAVAMSVTLSSAHAQVSPTASDTTQIAEIQLYGLNSLDPWSPLSRADLAAITTGVDQSVDTPSPAFTLSERLGDLNLGARSPDLPEACTIVSTLLDAVEADTAALNDALRARAVREGGDPTAELWWLPLWYATPNLLESAARRLISGYQMQTYHGGLREALCHDLAEPDFVVSQIGQQREHNDALLMLVAARRSFIDTPTIEYVSAATLVGEVRHQHSDFGNGAPMYRIQSESQGSESRRIAVARHPLMLVGHIQSNDPLVDDLYREATALRDLYQIDGGLHFALEVFLRARVDRRPSILFQGLAFSSASLELSGQFRRISFYDSLLANVRLNAVIAQDIELFGSTFVSFEVRDLTCSDLEFERIALLPRHYRFDRAIFDNVRCNSVIIRAAHDLAAYELVDGTWTERRDRGTSSLRFDDTEVHSFEVRNSSFDELAAPYLRVRGQIDVQDVIFRSRLNFFGGQAESVSFSGVRGVREVADESEDPPIGVINLSEMDVRGEISLTDVTAAEIWGSKTNAAVLRSVRGQYGKLELWRSNFGSVFLRGPDIGELLFWYAQFGSMEISNLPAEEDHPVSASVIGTIVGRFVEAGRLYIGLVDVESIRLTDLSANTVDLQCVRANQFINLSSADIGDSYLVNISTNLLNLNDSRHQQFYVSSTFRWSLGPDGIPIAVGEVGDGSTTNAGQNCPFGSTSNIDIIDMSEMEATTVRIESHVEELLYARALRTQSLVFEHMVSTLGPSAILSLRQSRIGSLVLPMRFLRSEEATNTILDIEGAEIGGVRIYDPHWDGQPYIDGNPDSETLSRAVRPQSPAESNFDLYADFLDSQLLPALQLTPETRRRDLYPGATYGFLRNSMSVVGLPDMVRQIAVLQNDHYAETLPQQSPARYIYRLGGVITNYGYNNGNAIKWLLILWLLGIVVLVIEWIVYRRKPVKVGSQSRLLSHYLVNGRRVRRRPQGAKATPAHSLPFIYIPFFSADRTVPTLSLDERFSRPGNSSAEEARAWWVVIALYLQRFAAFVIVVFMVGGILDVFQ